MMSDSDTTATVTASRLLADRLEWWKRQLSRELRLGLGRTHYVLHALLKKGLVKIENFKHNGNKLSCTYLFKPKRLREKLRSTCDFLARKEAKSASLERTIPLRCAEIRISGRSEQ